MQEGMSRRAAAAAFATLTVALGTGGRADAQEERGAREARAAATGEAVLLARAREVVARLREPEQRIGAAAILFALQPLGAAAVPLLTEVLDDRALEARVRHQALTVLYGLGAPEAAASLGALLLREDDLELRVTAAVALAYLGDPHQALLAALAREHPARVRAAALASGAARGVLDAARCVELLEAREPEAVRAAAIGALADLAPADPDRAVPALEAAVRREAGVLRAEAARALRLYGTPGCERLGALVALEGAPLGPELLELGRGPQDTAACAAAAALEGEPRPRVGGDRPEWVRDLGWQASMFVFLQGMKAHRRRLRMGGLALEVRPGDEVVPRQLIRRRARPARSKRSR